ncbi:PEP-CTERM sorting domain-containing protein [Verrucomicrobiaceae bacterium R5-34]|uniref:PEP-CTERM sorting domain-containing protein n=1 Tax=Oceaniferula flava TaxID=2800421 RepID=A0AAE2SD94_9BACT|nr:PEP-CTERM sorting domain-containing protein [Oceaniferula flavus]MBK1830318.1 PEP-CTERM sorting domain-containing protein [Verrucomicrobiaceae bacterium R5-34]MBK1854410.1 PEP-CTERM sorting domain-containing protein [Oceaniferula flavus]MBM1135716.1 PEP-CTERM sorting domain-containing protein [Oceaniferula flavus]
MIPHIIKSTALLSLVAMASSAEAVTIANSFERELFSTGNNTGVGARAGIGSMRIGDEDGDGATDQRGVTEFIITGQPTTTSASLEFDQTGILLGGSFDIIIEAYQANGAIDVIADYSSPSTGTVATFSSTDYERGDTGISFDVTDIYNAAIANGDTAIGFRFKLVDESPAIQQVVTYGNSVLNITTVPEPSSTLCITLGAGLLLLRRNRK